MQAPGGLYLQADVRPVDVIVGHIKVQRGGLLDACERDGHVVVVGLQGDPVDGGPAGEHEEGLGDDAGLHVAQQLQADGAAALGGTGGEEAQVAAAPVLVRTRVGPWEATHRPDTSAARQRACHPPTVTWPCFHRTHTGTLGGEGGSPGLPWYQRRSDEGPGGSPCAGWL